MTTTSNISTRPPPIPALTGMRSIAALSVALSHYTNLRLLPLPLSFSGMLDGGRPAVSFFFILSGFVLSYNYSSRSASTSRFYQARFARIYPTHLLCLLISAIPVIILIHRHDTLGILDRYAIRGNLLHGFLAALAAQLLLLTAWLPFAALNQPWNGPAWSISCEAFFYAIFPFISKRLKNRKSSHLRAIAALLWLSQGVLIIGILHFASYHRKGFLATQFPLVHVSEFLIGMIVALLCLRKELPVFVYRSPALVVSLCLLAIASLASWDAPLPQAYLQIPCFVGIISATAACPHRFAVLQTRPLVLMGEASFALYLVHIPIAYAGILLGVTMHYGWILLILTILLSIAMILLYEEPMRKRVLAAFQHHSQRDRLPTRTAIY